MWTKSDTPARLVLPDAHVALVSDETSQATLCPPNRSIERVLAPLDLIDVAAWCAFERSRSRLSPICPSSQLAHTLLCRLEWRNVLRRVTAQSAPLDAARAIYDPVAWVYEAFDAPAGLETILLLRLKQLRSAPFAGAQLLTLWKMLADAELESYFTYLLERQTLPGAWAARLIDELGNEFENLPLSHRRYIAWAGAREASAVLLRSCCQPAVVLASTAADMRRRTRWITAQPDKALGFVPSTSSRRGLLLSLFIDEITTLGERYWSEKPAIVDAFSLP